MKFSDSREMRQAKSAGRSVSFGSQTSSVVVWGDNTEVFQRLATSNLKDRSHRREWKASWAVGTKGVCGGAAFPEGGELGAADTAVLRKPTQARRQLGSGADSRTGRGWRGLPPQGVGPGPSLARRVGGAAWRRASGDWP